MLYFLVKVNAYCEKKIDSKSSLILRNIHFFAKMEIKYKFAGYNKIEKAAKINELKIQRKMSLEWFL